MEKESIVKEIFRKEIPVGELFVDIVWEDRVSYELYEFIIDANTTMDYVQKRIGMNLPKFVSDFVPERKVCFFCTGNFLLIRRTIQLFIQRKVDNSYAVTGIRGDSRSRFMNSYASCRHIQKMNITRKYSQKSWIFSKRI